MASTEQDQRRIDWSSATIEDGTLTVELTGDAQKGWGKRFETVLALLGHSGAGWERIRVRKSAIEVHGVREGAEQDLRQLLEGALQQANADLAPDSDGEQEQTAQQAEEDPQRAGERRMTETFRGFAALETENDEEQEGSG